MTGLPWIRLDTTTFQNPKLLALSALNQHRAIVCHVAGLAYAGKNGTAGFIIREALPFCLARPIDAKHLVVAEMWTERAGGWQINNWDEYQLSDDAAKARSEKAAKAAAIRWSQKQIRAVK